MKFSATKRKDGRWQSSITVVDNAGARKKIYVYSSTEMECLKKIHEVADKEGAKWETR